MTGVPFSAVAPGLMVFAVLLLSIYTSTSLVREVETRGLARYRTGGAGMAPLLIGTVAAQFLLAILAFALMLGAATMMGLTMHGSALAAFTVVLLTSVGVIGVGLGVAAFVRRREDATNLSLFVMLPMGFLNGGFFALPDWTLGAWHVDDLIPAKHAVDALRDILGGAGFAEVAPDLLWLALLGSLLMAAGTALFWGRRYRSAM